VTQQGKYWVTVTKRQNCQASDTVTVTTAFPSLFQWIRQYVLASVIWQVVDWQTTGGLYI